MFPITLGPYRSNFTAIVNAISDKGLIALDKGIEIEIADGEKVLLIAFTFAYIGDILQQQKNSRIKTQKANLGCRIYYIYVNDRSNLAYDTFVKGRYYNTAIYIRQDIARRTIQKARDKYSIIQGIDLSLDAIVLQERISPISNLIVTRPRDLAYSEYSGLSRMLYSLLIKGVLLLAIAKEYIVLLRTFPFLLSQLRI